MLKVRYFRVDLPTSLSEIALTTSQRMGSSGSGHVKVVASSEDELVINYSVERQIPIRRVSLNGEEQVESVTTLDIFSLRFFNKKKKTFLCLSDPPRGGRVIANLLDHLFPNENYFIEPLELNTNIIDRHISKFGAAKLVSAKVRDFEVFKGAIGKLEVSSGEGIPYNIAPFLKEKKYKVESLVYEISHLHKQGLIYYFSNGTVKASNSLIEIAFPAFEAVC
jgi:hypothetical protein